MLILTAFSKICRPTSPRWIEINIYELEQDDRRKTGHRERNTGEKVGDVEAAGEG